MRKCQDNRAYFLFFAALVVSGIVIVLGQTLLRPVVVRGISMSPNYNDGDVVRTVKFNGVEDLNYGDVIVFNDNSSGLLIKRVVALPGDVVRIENGVLVLNGNAVSEEFPVMESAGIADIDVVIGGDEVFVLGDNRNSSRDSRVIGPVKTSAILRVVNGPLFGK